jgi:HK97 family phage major capsid protein
MNAILEAIKTSLVKEKKVTVNLREASALTASGSGVGGRVIYDDAFASLRYANPLRAAGSRVITTIGSDEAFVVKTGNVTNPTNPWGYTFTPNVGTPNTATSFWQLQVKSIAAQVPVRTAILSDVNNLDATLLTDIGLEFSTLEAQSMMFNSDQSGSSTTTYGGVYGLRGLNSYPSGSTAAFGSNGSALTNGLHTVKTIASATGAAISYNDLAGLTAALPPQYYALPTTAWMMHPTTIAYVRELKDSSGLPLFLDVGEKDGVFLGSMFGIRVIANPFMDEIGASKLPVYLAAWDNFVTIADNEEMSFQWMDQTAPGYMTLFAEKRVCSTIRDVFGGVRLST